jgi:hypothetical protein
LLKAHFKQSIQHNVKSKRPKSATRPNILPHSATQKRSTTHASLNKVKTLAASSLVQEQRTMLPQLAESYRKKAERTPSSQTLYYNLRQKKQRDLFACITRLIKDVLLKRNTKKRKKHKRSNNAVTYVFAF